MTEKTRWFPPSVKPVRKGVYQREYHGGVMAYSRWDGSRWLSGSSNFQDAKHAEEGSFDQKLPWRGLIRATHSTN